MSAIPTSGTHYYVAGEWVPWDVVGDREIGRCPLADGLEVECVDYGQPQYRSEAKDLGDRVEFVLPTGQRATVAAHSERGDSTVSAISYRFCRDYSGRTDGGVIQVLRYEIAEDRAAFGGCPCVDYTLTEVAS